VSTIINVRQGIKDRLNTIPNLNASAYMPDHIICPAAFPTPNIGDYGYSMANNISFDMIVAVLIDLAQGFESAQKEMDLYLEESGAKSILAAIKGDASLGGACSVCRIAGYSDYGFIVYAGIQYLGCRIKLEILG
jgi:hypothetical protein